MLREPGRPTVAYTVTPDDERRSVGGAFINLTDEMRERMGKGEGRREAGEGVDAKPGTEWLEAGTDRPRPAPQRRGDAQACAPAGWGTIANSPLRAPIADASGRHVQRLDWAGSSLSAFGSIVRES